MFKAELRLHGWKAENNFSTPLKTPCAHMQNSFTCVSVRVCATGLNTYSHYCSSTRKAVSGKYLIRKQANQEKSP